MTQQQVPFVPLKDGPIDPNRARVYSILLSVAAGIVALVTLRSNMDYFGQYYAGWGYWMRVIPFWGVELAIVTLPLTKGFGNTAQWKYAKFFEVVLVALSLTHTFLVGDSMQTKKTVEITRATAKADYDQLKADRDKIIKQNDKMRSDYNQQLSLFRQTSINAAHFGQSAPTEPPKPKYLDVPAIDEGIVKNATLNAEEEAEKQVNHSVLLQLLFVMIAFTIAAATVMVSVSDTMVIQDWLKRGKAVVVKAMTSQAAPVKTVAAQSAPVTSLPVYTDTSPSVPVQAVGVPLAQEPRRVQGFARSAITETQTASAVGAQSGGPSVSQSVRGSVQTVTAQAVTLANGRLTGRPANGGYSLQSGRVYLCYASAKVAGQLSQMPERAALLAVRDRVVARREEGNKAQALAEIGRLIGEV